MQRLLRAIGILLLHIPPLTIPFISTGKTAWIAFLVSFVAMQFAICGGLHRFFAHRSFETSRTFQFLIALMGASCFGDPIGFSGRHRLHHKNSDTALDFHGPRHGVWFGWFGHLLEDGFSEDELGSVTRDLTKYPELVWLHRWTWVPGIAAMTLICLAGGFALFATAYCLSWCIVVHGSSAVNYFCHKGTHQRYATGDRSSNNVWLALLMLGEGWHNNHHHYPSAARAGVFWYEIDVLYYILKALSWIGLVWNLHEIPDSYESGRSGKPLDSRAIL